MRKYFLFLWFSIAGLALFFWFYFPGVSRYRDLKIQEEGIRKELAVMDEKVLSLARERDLLKNDVAYLEKVIRDELGLVKPGEIVYKFVPDNSQRPAQSGSSEVWREAEGASALTPAVPLPSPAGSALPQMSSSTQASSFASSQKPSSVSTQRSSSGPAAAAPKPAQSTSSGPVYPRQETR